MVKSSKLMESLDWDRIPKKYIAVQMLDNSLYLYEKGGQYKKVNLLFKIEIDCHGFKDRTKI